MEYLEIKENKITGHFSGTIFPKSTDEKQYIKVKSFLGAIGDSVDLYEVTKLEGKEKIFSVLKFSDDELIEKGLLIDNRGIYYSTDRKKKTIKINKISDFEIPEGYTKKEPKKFDKWDGSKWVEDSELKAETERQKIISDATNYLRNSDYKVIKAMETGTTLEELYPGEKKKREDARKAINDNT